MKHAPMMPWIDQLANANMTDFPTRSDRIAELIEEASAATGHAAALMNKATELRSRAYYEMLSLEGEAKGKWGCAEVEQAKRRVEW